MSSEERQQILKMVEDGKITADQALALIKELEQDSDEEEPEAFQAEAGASSGTEAGYAYESASAPEFERTAARVRSLWQIPFWIGVGIMVLSAFGIYSILQNSGYSFWFYCLWFPFALGVLIMAVAGWGRSAPWLFVDVQQKPGEGPARITFGFPMPLSLAAWGMRNFGHHIPKFDRGRAKHMADMLSAVRTSGAPLIVDVDDDDGEKVRVHIG